MAENDLENIEDDSEDNESLVTNRIPLSLVKKQTEELKQAQQAFEASNPKSKRIFNAVSMYSVAMDFALMLAVPLLGFIFLGRWMDAKYNTKYYVLIGIVLGIATSSVAIGRQINRLSKQMKSKK